MERGKSSSRSQSTAAATMDESVALMHRDWLKRFTSGTLQSNHLRLYWAQHVPELLAPQVGANCLAIAYDERAIRRVLLDQLERFLAGENDEPGRLFAALKAKEAPTSFCGRLFRVGEPTYSCRDCGTDPTCVICAECFKKSVHRFHKYRMGMSGGGGYCDCGDVEAWKSDPACEFHSQGFSVSKTGEEDDKVLDDVPRELVQRLHFVMETILTYAHEMLTWTKGLELPKSLQREGELPETYGTMVFNDETHTYELVIQTLVRSIQCKDKEAIEYATTIDREGRSLIKVSSFLDCQLVQQQIERNTSRHGHRPLRSAVMHMHVVAHQTFATRLLSWLKHLVSQFKAFRIICCNVLSTSCPLDEPYPLLRCVLRADAHLWKSARVHWHQLLIASLLMDIKCKRIFAKMFIKEYPDMMKAFMADDHDHGFSVSSLSVQMFSVPTISQMLIEEEQALCVLMRTLLSECDRHISATDRRLYFERSNPSPSFRRAQFVFYDVRYLLYTIPPAPWSEALQKNFVHGVHSVHQFLVAMQGMDSVVRQVGQHVEFEAEWETAVNVQLRLGPVLGALIRWCAVERAVLVKCLRHSFRLLTTQCALKDTIRLSRTVGSHTTECIEYDVSKQAVSVHWPVTRFAAGLLVAYGEGDLEQCMPSNAKMTPEEIMELPLRTQVMVAQFRAGMWRRNGYSLLNQVYFYQNVRLRAEMYDRDVQLIQWAGAHMDPNDFLVRMVNRYGLVTSWTQQVLVLPGLDDESARQTTTIADECMTLLLILVAERYVPGIGQVTIDDRIKKEVIQQLCIEPMPHSQLVRQLPKDDGYGISENAQVEELIRKVATFRKSAASTTGRYECKPEYYKDFNPFFYHYTREDQSKAEEVQLRRRRQAREPLCLPPPVPPPFTRAFAPLLAILDCPVFLRMATLILMRALEPNQLLFSETQLERLLHCIGIGLHEQTRMAEAQDPSEYAGVPPSLAHYSATLKEAGIVALIEAALSDPLSRIDVSRTLLEFTLQRLRKLIAEADGTTASDNQMDVDESSSPSASVKKRSRDQEAAAARRAKIMAQMFRQQNNFIREHQDLLKETEAMENTSCEANASDSLTAPSGGGPSVKDPALDTYVCILCREEQTINQAGTSNTQGFGHTATCLVVCAMAQRSAVLALRPLPTANQGGRTSGSDGGSEPRSGSRTDSASSAGGPNSAPAGGEIVVMDAEGSGGAADGNDVTGNDVTGSDVSQCFLPSADFRLGTHLSLCGHVMHASCWKAFFESVVNKERRRPMRYGRHISFNVERQEFLCPLCECLSNCVIPIVPSIASLTNVDQSDISDACAPDQLDIDSLLTGLRQAVEKTRLIPLSGNLFKSSRRSEDGGSRENSEELMDAADAVPPGQQPQQQQQGQQPDAEIDEEDEDDDVIMMMDAEPIDDEDFLLELERAMANEGAPMDAPGGPPFPLPGVAFPAAAVAAVVRPRAPPGGSGGTTRRKTRQLSTDGSSDTVVSLLVSALSLSEIEGFSGSDVFRATFAQFDRSATGGATDQATSAGQATLRESLKQLWSTVHTVQTDSWPSHLQLMASMMSSTSWSSIGSGASIAGVISATFMSVAYTIHSAVALLELETTSSNGAGAAGSVAPSGADCVSATEEKNALLGDLSTRQLECLRALVRSAAVALQVVDCRVMSSAACHVLRYLLLAPVYQSARESIFELDAFGLLVNLTFVLPSLFRVRKDDSEAMSQCGPTTRSRRRDEERRRDILYGASPMPLPRTMLQHHLVQIVTTLHLAQCIVAVHLNGDKPEEKSTLPFTSSKRDAEVEAAEVEPEVPPTEDDDIRLELFCREVLAASGITIVGGGLSVQFLRRVRLAMIPFLRSASIFMHYLTDIPYTGEVVGDVGCGKGGDARLQLYYSLFSYLCRTCRPEVTSSPSLSTSAPPRDNLFLNSATLRQLALSWCRHPRVLHLWSQSPYLTCRPLRARHLIPLPHDYSELMNIAAQFVCPNAVNTASGSSAYARGRVGARADDDGDDDGDDDEAGGGGGNDAGAVCDDAGGARSPTLCLVCGRLLCSQSYCCQQEFDSQRVGACTYHAQECSAGIGIFLRIRDCKILFLAAKSKGCYIPAPYVDEYGETDPGLNRGHPLFLSQLDYDRIQRLWLSHGIQEQVAHALEQSPSLSATNWYLM